MSAAADPAKLTRKGRRAARHAAAGRIMPPEGVYLSLPVAGVGVRLGAQIIDVILTSVFAIALLIFLATSGMVDIWSLMAVGMLLFFVIRVPYYVLSELAWNGQTLGKRFLKIKVVSHTGGSLTTHAIVLRNMLKEAEIFLPGTLLFTLTAESPIASWMAFGWILMAFAIPLSNPHRQRLGDMMAGTHVVHLPVPVLLRDMAADQPVDGTTAPNTFTFLPHQLNHYGRYELQTLESFLRKQARPRDSKAHLRNRDTLAAIVEKVRAKIGYGDAVAPKEHTAFLQAFYNAQRAHLEQRQLFGDRRSDKHYRARDDQGG